jgi:hypothetical protein
MARLSQTALPSYILNVKHGGGMAEITGDERDSVILTTQAIINSDTPVAAIGHAFDGLAEIMLSILYELRVANEGKSKA